MLRALASLALMWPRTRRHMWVEFAVGSHPYPEGFSPGTTVFLPPQKPPTFLNSNSIWKQWVQETLWISTKISICLFYFIIFYFILMIKTCNLSYKLHSTGKLNLSDVNICNKTSI